MTQHHPTPRGPRPDDRHEVELPHLRLSHDGYRFLGCTRLERIEPHVRDAMAAAFERGCDVQLVHDAMRRGAEQAGWYSAYALPVSAKYRGLTAGERARQDALLAAVEAQRDGEHGCADDDASPDVARVPQISGRRAVASGTSDDGSARMLGAVLLWALVCVAAWVVTR